MLLGDVRRCGGRQRYPDRRPWPRTGAELSGAYRHTGQHPDRAQAGESSRDSGDPNIRRTRLRARDGFMDIRERGCTRPSWL